MQGGEYFAIRVQESLTVLRYWLFESISADDDRSHKGPAYDQSQIMRSERKRESRFGEY